MKYYEPEKSFPEGLHKLSWRDLRDLSKHHTRMAESFQKRSQRLRGIELVNKQAKDRVDELADSYKVVLQYIAKGYNSADSAIAAASRELKLHEDTVRGWWKIFTRNRDQAARDAREKAIISMMNAGIKNTEISARLSIHVNTVSRTITKHLQAALTPRDRARLRKRRRDLKPPQSSHS